MFQCGHMWLIVRRGFCMDEMIFSFKNVLGAAYNQVRFIVRNLRYFLYDVHFSPDWLAMLRISMKFGLNSFCCSKQKIKTKQFSAMLWRKICAKPPKIRYHALCSHQILCVGCIPSCSLGLTFFPFENQECFLKILQMFEEYPLKILKLWQRSFILNTTMMNFGWNTQKFCASCAPLAT